MAKVEAVLLSPSAEKITETQVAINEYDFIRFTFADMNGVLRGALLPAEAAGKYLTSGIGCMSALQAFSPTQVILPKEVQDRHLSNMQIIPDLSTLHAVPWIEKYRVGQFLAETFWNPATPQEACTRNMARKMLSKLDDMGLRFYSGAELEFVLMNPESQLAAFSSSRCWSIQTLSHYESWFCDVATNMKKAGVCIKMMHAESSPGLFEFVTEPMFGIESIDSVLILKQGIKEMALQSGWQANFMAFPFLGEERSSGHSNFSVWHKDSDRNVFQDDTSEDGISEFGKHWIAGMIHHAKALTSLCCITSNCYRTLHDPWFPQQANWSIGDRTTMFRVKNDSPGGLYIENRLPTAPFNPYLVMAATIAAGIDGIVHKLPCPKPCDISEAQTFPSSLPEALDCLREDTIMVEALGKVFVEWFIQSKTEGDLKLIEAVTDDAERLELERKQYVDLM